jgi:surface antigen
MRTLLLALALAVSAARASAQVVEKPEPFDSAGRLELVTPIVAARLQLQPPAWRITGDYREARLFATGDGGYVIVVTRRDGAQERYAITAADRDYLRARTANLPPNFAEQVTQSVRTTAREGLQSIQQPSARGAFIVSQSLLGLLVYAPSFAYAVTDNDAGRVPVYLLAAGATYFGAATLSREMRINGPQNVLATRTALSGGAAGYALTYALDATDDGKAAGIFVGSLAGTAMGLWIGRGMTSADAMAASFGSDAFALTTAGILRAAGTLRRESRGGEPKAAAVAIVGAGLVGYPLGATWARRARYNVTAGDVGTLWVSGGIGTAAAAALVSDLDSDEATYIGLTAGFAAGVWAGDRLLVRRFDHSWGQFATVAAGAVGGGLMGAGIAALVDQDDPANALVWGLMTAGAVTGVGVANWVQVTPADVGRTRTGMRFRVDGTAIAMAAGGVPGRHALVTITF